MQRFMALMFGLFLYSLGIVLTIKADIGFAPWDVFHVGLADTLGITIGMSSIFVAIFIVIVDVLLGEKIGIGTILNMVVIGLFIDLILFINILPTTDNILLSIIMLLLGLVIIAVATYFYIGSGFGAGPRDSLMVGLNKKTKMPIGLCRGLIEVAVVIIGYFLGGKVGIGTLIAAFAIGPIIQLIFTILKFDAAVIEHETINETLLNIKKKIR